MRSSDGDRFSSLSSAACSYRYSHNLIYKHYCYLCCITQFLDKNPACILILFFFFAICIIYCVIMQLFRHFKLNYTTASIIRNETQEVRLIKSLGKSNMRKNTLFISKFNHNYIFVYNVTFLSIHYFEIRNIMNK